MSNFRRREGTRNVRDAARSRIEKAVASASRVYVSFSGGKDSLCIVGIVEELLIEKRIDPGKLQIIFIDEEAIYPCVEQIVLEWKKKFEKLGVKFNWLCIPVKHFNCFNELESDESFICWDPRAKDKWIRQPPKFAIRSHPKLVPGDTYQDFLDRSGGVNLIGTRSAESYQRVKNISKMSLRTGVGDRYKLYPIHDWTDSDVWLYIKERGFRFPEVYLFMHKAGFNRKQLRISQFFSIDTAKALVRMFEFYPELYEKIINREPNAYLAMYYWDSEMFRRNTSTRKQLEGKVDKDWEKEALRVLEEKTKHKDYTTYKRVQRFILRWSHLFTDNVWKRMYEMLVSGDPKRRTFRALYSEFGKGKNK